MVQGVDAVETRLQRINGDQPAAQTTAEVFDKDLAALGRAAGDAQLRRTQQAVGG